MIKRLAWVTTREARGRDEDEPIGLAALQRAGVQVELVDWDDAEAEWAAFDRVVLRSSWDYPERLAEFLHWLERTAALTEVLNPPATVRWNLDKHYLGDLADAGVPITPTVFVEPGDSVEFPVGDFVVKPAIGAGSRDASVYGPDQLDAALAHVDRMLGLGQSVLVQPFLASVAVEGEWPLVFFKGVFSHAASKRVTLPRAGTVDDLFAAETNSSHTATAEQIAVAQAAMRVVADRVGVPAYARVDLVNDDGGSPCVLEVELIEPSLFLPYAGRDAADRFAAALLVAAPESAHGSLRRMPGLPWTPDQLGRIEAADELEIAVRNANGTFRRWVPIWAVCAGGQVFVRTWHRRADGWFGRVIQSRRARIRVPGLEVGISVRDIGDDTTGDLRASIDRAYRDKYGRYGGPTVDRMVTDEAAATTLRLEPEQATPIAGG